MSIEVNERLLVTFALFAYKQEKFVREAVEGAFAQTYSPLEIILSDDCSPDCTFEILQSMAREYQGRHRVILNRNATNQHIGGHVNRVFELAQGHLVVVAAGDDVSLPNRVQINYEAWENSGRQAMCLYSAYNVTLEDGLPTRETGMEFRYTAAGTIAEEKLSISDFFTAAKPRIFGCAAAYRPCLLKVFGPLSAAAVHEDEVLAFRATMLGSFLRIELPLVNYRLHGNNVFGTVDENANSLSEIERDEARNQRELKSRLRMYEDFLKDLEQGRKEGLVDLPVHEQVLTVCENRVALLRGQLDFHGGSFLKKVRSLMKLRRDGLPQDSLRRLLYRMLPGASFRVLKMWNNRLRVRSRT